MKKIFVVVLAIAIFLTVAFVAVKALGNTTDGTVIKKSDFSGVTMSTPTPTPKVYGPSIPSVIHTPAPTVAPTVAPTAAPTVAPTVAPTAAPTVVPAAVSVVASVEWWDSFVQESASLLYEQVLGTCLDSQKQMATFAWAIRAEDLDVLVEGDEYVELTQYVKYWDEYALPQNSLGVLVVKKDQKPEGWRSKMAGSAAPKTSVEENGILNTWRIGISADLKVLKKAEFEYDPMVVVLRNPDPVSGQQIFLVIDGKENKPVTNSPVVQQQVTGGSTPDYDVDLEPVVTPTPEYNQKPTPGGISKPEYNDKPTGGNQENPDYNNKPSGGTTGSGNSGNADYSDKPSGGGTTTGSHTTTSDDLSGAGSRN